MPTSQDLPNSGRGDLQPETRKPVADLDIIPGYTLPTDPPGSPPGYGARVQLLEEAGQVAEDLAGRIVSSVVDPLEEAGQIAAQLEAVILGQIREELDEATATAAKITAKIYQAMEDQLSSAAAIASGVGYQYPTNEEIGWDNAAGERGPPPTLDDLLPLQPGTRPPVPLVPLVPPPLPPGAEESGSCPAWSMRGPPSYLLPAAPATDPSGVEAVPWLHDGNARVCYAREVGTFWFCDLLGTPYPVVVAIPDGYRFYQDFQRQLTTSLFGRPGLIEVHPIGGTQRHFPADAGCPPVTPPIDPNTPLPPCRQRAYVYDANALPGQPGYLDPRILLLPLCDDLPPPLPPQPPVNPDAQCPPLPFEVCPPPLPEIPVLGQMEDDDCAGFKTTIDGFANFQDKPTGIIGMDSGEPVATVNAPPSWWRILTGRTENTIPAIVNRLERWVRKTIVATSKSAPCKAKEATGIWIVQGMLRFVNSWFQIIPKAVMVPMDQASNFLCQYNLPSGAEADAAYINGTITKGVWECWHQAEGNMLRSANAVMEGKRARPSATMAVLLYRRKAIDKAKYDELMRGEGFTSEADKDRFYAATQAWPHLDDVIRMMIRDVNNDPLMLKYDADKLFKENTEGDLFKYAEGLGITKELLKMYWRAHWKIPSYTQLGEMYHRYRYEDTPEDLKMSVKDIRTALLYDDVMPFWVDRMIGISHRPMTRIDSTRAYQLHVFEEDKLLRHYQKFGYDDETSQIMVDLAAAKRLAAENQKSGLPTPRTIANQYAAGVLGEDEVRQQLGMLGYKEGRLDRAMNSIKIARSVRLRQQGIASVQKGYLSGLISDVEAQDQLRQVGVDTDAVSELYTLWTLQRRARGKVAPATALCKWRDRNLIDAAQQLAGLIRVGWSLEDARRIVSACESDIGERNFARAEKLRKAALREAEQAAKAEEARRKLIPTGGIVNGQSGG